SSPHWQWCSAGSSPTSPVAALSRSSQRNSCSVSPESPPRMNRKKPRRSRTSRTSWTSRCLEASPMPEPQIGQPTYQQQTVTYPIMIQFRLQDITTNLDRFVAEFQDLSDPERAALATNVANAISIVYALVQPIAKARKIDIDRTMREAVRPYAGKDDWPSV